MEINNSELLHMYVIWFCITTIIQLYIANFDKDIVKDFYQNPQDLFEEYKNKFIRSKLRIFWKVLYYLITISLTEIFRLITIIPTLPLFGLFILIREYDNRDIICKIFFKKGCK